MKFTLAILACLLLTPIASAEPLSWFWRTDNYRVPLPQSHLAGYALIVERVNIHNGDVSMAQQVAGSPIYASIIGRADTARRAVRQRTASAVAARVDAFLAAPTHQRPMRFGYRCPVCDLMRYLAPRGQMCRICEVEFEAVMAKVRQVLS